jgi:hypothetical protein
MGQQESVQHQEPFVVERFTPAQYVYEVLKGLAIVLGLGLLWLLEIIRDGCFAMLDRMNWRPRPRKGRPFPPGPQRKHPTVEAHR